MSTDSAHHPPNQQTNHQTIKPPALQPGDTIGVVSPSWGGAGLFPHRVEQAVEQLNNLGYQVRFGRHALNHNGYVSDSPQNRAQDIQDLFMDPQIKAIIAAIGGDHSCQLLPWLDFDPIRRNPKIFMGFSDITVLNVAIWQQTGLVTFNGPALLTDFAEYPQIYAYSLDYWLKTIGRAGQPAGLIQPALEWTDEFLDWAQKLDQQRPRQMRPSPGWTWLKPGRGEGRLIGGCLESLQHLRGTPYWPSWEGAIFFFEISEEKPSPATVDGILMDYDNMGVLSQLNGLLVGRPYDYTVAAAQHLREVILARTAPYDFPIITDMDFGHTSPQFTLPLGCQALIDTTQERFELREAAVSI